jgi:hypothetical protein
MKGVATIRQERKASRASNGAYKYTAATKQDTGLDNQQCQHGVRVKAE